MRNHSMSLKGFLTLSIALAFNSQTQAQTSATKRVTLQPVLLKSATNPYVSGNISLLSNFEAAADKIWSQAGIEVVILPSKVVENDTYTNLSTSFGPKNISTLAGDVIGSLGSVTAAGNGISYAEMLANPKTINVWFVPMIGGSSSIGGTSMENSPGQSMNGIAIANSATSKQALGALAHEIGHVLGLSHTSAGGDTNNLMEASSKIHTKLMTDIVPDGLQKYQLTPTQISTARTGYFAADIPLPVGTLSAAPLPDGSTGLRVTGLLSATDGKDGTEDQLGFLSDVLAQAPAGKPVGIFFEAYDYVQGAIPNVRSKASFQKATKLIQNTLPKLNAGTVLIVSTTLESARLRKSKPTWTTFRPDLSSTKFWQLIETNDATFQANWQANVAMPYKNWSDEILTWAANSGFAKQLKLEVCPQVDDAATSTTAYTRLAEWTASVGLNPAICLFRSTALRGAPNQGMIEAVDNVELHQFFDSYGAVDYKWLDANLKAGYRVSNERYPLTASAFADLQNDALSKGASAHFWSAEFGDPLDSTLPPYQRGPLVGLDDACKSRLVEIINQRNGF